MPGWHERREILESVRVNAPHDGADHLSERRDPDDCESLQSDTRRMEREKECEDARRDHAERQLTRAIEMLVDEEPGDDPGADDEQRDGGEATHRTHLRRNGGRGSPEPSRLTGRLSRVQGATDERENGMFGLSLGGVIVIIGIVIAIFWSLWIGVIVALIGLLAFGGFARGRWY